MTSYAEKVPLALLEARVCGLPIVSTSVGGIGEVIQDGLKELHRDPQPLASKTIKALSKT